MVRSVPMRCVAKRARKSEPPHVRAVSRPRKIPMNLVSRSQGNESVADSAEKSFSRKLCQRNFRKHLGLRGATLHFEAKFGHDFLQVFPDVAFGCGVSQQIGG